MERIFNYVIFLKWEKKPGKDEKNENIIENKSLRNGTFNDLVKDIKHLSETRLAYNKKRCPILLTTSRKPSTTKTFAFQTDQEFKGNHEIITLDYESADFTRRQAENLIKKMKLRFISYNSFNNGICPEKKHRFRIIIPLNRSYTPDEIKMIKQELTTMFSFGNDCLDVLASFRQNSAIYLPVFYEGKRKPKISENEGSVLNLESMLLKAEAKKMKVKPLPKNTTIPYENELNEDMQEKELAAVLSLKTGENALKTHNFLNKATIRLKIAGFDDVDILRELEPYETSEHRGRVGNILLKDNYIQSLEIDPKFFRYKYVTRYGQQWKYDTLKKLYYNEVMDNWVKQPRSCQHLSDDNILIREFEIASFDFLKEHFKNQKIVEATMVLLHFVVMTNLEIDGFIRKLQPSVQNKFYYKDDNGKKLRKGVYFNSNLLQKFKEITKLNELDLVTLPCFDTKTEIEGRILDWLTGLNNLLHNYKLMVLYKEKIEGVNPIGNFKYFNWLTYLLPLPKLKNSNYKEYKLKYEPAVNLYKAMKEELVFKIPELQEFKGKTLLNKNN